MKTRNFNFLIKLSTVLAMLGLSACAQLWLPPESESGGNTLIGAQQTYGRPDPGVQEFVWEPPMVDVIDVPPGLDPEGHYYRPAHQEVVEIRQGRWKYYRQPN